MSKIKYDSSVMQYISLFESLTGAKLKDCIVDGNVMFIVNENEIGKAVGKKGSNVRRIESLLKKKIKVVEFSEDIAKFVNNLIYPLKSEVSFEEGVVSLHASDTKTKGMLIGRDRSRINSIKSILKRYFKVDDVKVV